MRVSRLRDMLAGAIGVAATAPLIVALAGLILMIDGRPIFFTQVRTGLHGRLFRLIKFRTMTDERGQDGNLLPDALRITAIGRVLRHFRIDELPQFWNILIGNMSLVGPRPLLATSLAVAADGGRLRGSVRPGLTGWAQVNGNTLLTEVDKIALDEWYVLNRSFWLDCRIMLKTLQVLLWGERLNSIAIGRAHASGSCRRG